MTVLEFIRKVQEADRRWPFDSVVGGILGVLLLFVVGQCQGWWQ